MSASGFTPASRSSADHAGLGGINGDEFIHGDPTHYEQLMLELVNRARANPVAEADRLGIELNEGLPAGTISPVPKPPLAFHPVLIDSARAHSIWMLQTDTFSHTGIDGSDPGERMSAAGYSFTGSWAWGENIAWGGSTGPIDPLKFTIDRHEGLFRSPGHRENICSDWFQEVGIGIETGIFTDGWDYNALMVTQNFGMSGATPGPLLLGVAFEDLDGDDFYDPGEGIPGITVTAGSGSWFAITSASGGYALPYTTAVGPISVVFSGGPLTAPVQYEMIASGDHLKLDLDLVGLRQLRFVDGSLSYSESRGFEVTIAGSPGDAFILQHSMDLQIWSNISSHVLQERTMVVNHLSEIAEGSHFYRLIWDR